MVPYRWMVLIALTISAGPVLADKYDDAVAASRDERDVARDALRQPAKVLRWIGIEEGMTVLDMGAGDGYYTELLARLVGPGGTVYVQNPAVIYERFGDEAITGRLADDRLPAAVRIDDELTGLGIDSGTVDLALAHLIWHDFHWIYSEVDPIVDELMRIVEPGGRVVIIDHAAPTGTGATRATPREGSTHRIEEAFVVKQFTDAGFELVERSYLLSNPADDRNEPFFSESLRGKPTDRFALIFRKP